MNEEMQKKKNHHRRLLVLKWTRRSRHRPQTTPAPPFPSGSGGAAPSRRLLVRILIPHIEGCPSKHRCRLWLVAGPSRLLLMCIMLTAVWAPVKRGLHVCCCAYRCGGPHQGRRNRWASRSRSRWAILDRRIWTASSASDGVRLARLQARSLPEERRRLPRDVEGHLILC